jgi:hypothetical protein
MMHSTALHSADMMAPRLHRESHALHTARCGLLAWHTDGKKNFSELFDFWNALNVGVLIIHTSGSEFAVQAARQVSYRSCCRCKAPTTNSIMSAAEMSLFPCTSASGIFAQRSLSLLPLKTRATVLKHPSLLKPIFSVSMKN